MDAQALNKTLHDLAVERFGADGIARTEMQETFDHYGDPLLVAQVVLTAEPEAVDGAELAGFSWRLLERLERVGEARWPMTRFFSASDAPEVTS